MTADIGLVLFILATAVTLFATERIRVDLVALLVLLALLLTGLLTTEEAFSGFSNPAVITVWAIYIISASLNYTGIADILGQFVGRIAGRSEKRLIFVLMLVVGVMSAFMNNIGAAAVMLPVAINLGKKMEIAPSKLLIPLAFGSLLGGTTTLIGTPPNLLVSTALSDAGLEPFKLFDYAPMGILIMISSIIYMVTIGRHLLPSYKTATHTHTRELVREYHLRDYLAELYVLPDSPLIGKTLTETRLGETADILIIGISRNGRRRMGDLQNRRIQEGDTLIVEGVSQEIVGLQDQIGVTLSSRPFSESTLRSSEVAVAEVVISQLADFVGQTLKFLDFRSRFDLNVLAIWREEAPIIGHLADVQLRLGDTLLVQGRRERLEALRDNNAFLLLRPLQAPPPRRHKAPLNLIIFISMIALVTTGTLHISTAAVLGAAIAVLTGCLTMDEAYKSIEWKSVFLIAGMLPMGIAMQKTGTAQYMADQMINLVGGLGLCGILMGIFVLTTVLTAFMSNAAAAVLVAPIAIQIALNLQVNPHAFAMGVAIAASSAFLTPVGHQACILVYGPGGYRFLDFTKVGLPLTLLIWFLSIIALPLLFPF